MILDNIDLIREKVLIFDNKKIDGKVIEDDFYMISILQRRKDHPEIGANENCRMLTNFYVKNLEYFNRKISLIKDYCDHFKARAYIRPQVRSCLSCNRLILKYMADQIDNSDLAYATLTRQLIAGYHDSKAKRIVLDLDDCNLQEVQSIYDYIYNHIKTQQSDKIANKVFILPTFNGYHIISPGFNPNIMKDIPKFKDSFKDVWHSDGDTILYAVK